MALVTGASSGIGAAIARELAAAGFRVYGASRRVLTDPPVGVEQLAVDVKDNASVRHSVEQVLREAGQIDVLVNAAGYLCAGAIEEVSIGEAQ